MCLHAGCPLRHVATGAELSPAYPPKQPLLLLISLLRAVPACLFACRLPMSSALLGMETELGS